MTRSAETPHAERPVVVNAEAVRFERVQVGARTVTEQEAVGSEVRKERFEFDGNDASTQS